MIFVMLDYQDSQGEGQTLYLVTTDHFGGPPLPPDQLATVSEQVIAGLEKLSKLLKDKKIVAGGTPAGQKRHVFIVDAESNDEVTELVQTLPFWLAHRWEIIPLESWSHHIDFLRSQGS